MVTKLIKYITLEEFSKILKAEKKKEFKLAYILGFGSGLRISEIVGYSDKVPALTSDNIDLQKHQVRVISGKGSKDRITVTSPGLNETNIKLLPLKIPRRTLQERLKRIALKSINKNISFHTLRHGFGNYMVNEKNVPIPMVQQMMGHSRIDTTGIYTKANPIQAIGKGWEAWE